MVKNQDVTLKFPACLRLNGGMDHHHALAKLRTLKLQSHISVLKQYCVTKLDDLYAEEKLPYSTNEHWLVANPGLLAVSPQVT